MGGWEGGREGGRERRRASEQASEGGTGGTEGDEIPEKGGRIEVGRGGGEWEVHPIQGHAGVFMGKEHGRAVRARIGTAPAPPPPSRPPPGRSTRTAQTHKDRGGRRPAAGRARAARLTRTRGWKRQRCSTGEIRGRFVSLLSREEQRSGGDEMGCCLAASGAGTLAGSQQGSWAATPMGGRRRPRWSRASLSDG